MDRHDEQEREDWRRGGVCNSESDAKQCLASIFNGSARWRSNANIGDGKDRPESGSGGRLKQCPACSCTVTVELSLPRNRCGDALFRVSGVAAGLKRCRRCGLEFVDPRPTASLLTAYYEQPGYPAHQGGVSPEDCAKAKFRIVGLPSPWKGARLLDIGCGNGAQLEEFRRAEWNCVGMEPSVHGRVVASQRGFTVYEDLQSVVAGEAPFDVITLYHVLEHVADLDGLFAAIKVLLTPEGRVVIEVPNLRSLRALIFPLLPERMRETDDRYRAFPIHLYGFSRRNLITLLQQRGFRVTRLSTVGFGLEWRARQTDCQEVSGVQYESVAMGRTGKPPWRRMARWVWGLMEKAGMGENLTVHVEVTV